MTPPTDGRCADSTALRAHLDHPTLALEAHLDSCPTCAGLLRSVAEDAGVTQQALALLDPVGSAPMGSDTPDQGPSTSVEVALAATLARIHAEDALNARRHRRDVRGQREGRFTGAARRLALAGAAAVLLLALAVTPTGRDAIAQMLDGFRGEQLQVITIDPAGWVANGHDSLASLATLGEVDLTGVDGPTSVSDLAAGEALSGITAPTITGPEIIDQPTDVIAMAPGTARLTLVQRDGNGVPDDLDGATLVVSIPGAVGARFDGEGSLGYVVGRAGVVEVTAEGAPLADIRAFILSRDELPADLRDQLAAIGDWRSTIPIPVPLDGPGWEKVEVGGRPGIAFGDDSGLGAVVLRQDPDGVTAAGGMIPVSRAVELVAGA